MKGKPFYIYATSTNIWLVDEKAPDLELVVKELWGKRIRRINRFIELALVGAKRCVGASPIPIESSFNLILATSRGNVAQVTDTMRQMFTKQRAPMPFDFMNITNNMAGFYIAQGLNLNSSNLTLAHRTFAFESMLDIATLQFENETNKSYCLVGTVEQCAFPLYQHRQRLGVARDASLAEASHWMLIGNDQGHAIAKCLFIGFFKSMDDFAESVIEYGLDAGTVLSCGFGVANEDLDTITEKLNLSQYYHYQEHSPCHETEAAYAVNSFIEKFPKQDLLFVNEDEKGRYSAVLINVL